MARTTNKLIDSQCRSPGNSAKPFKLADGDGMYLLVTPEGGRYWRLNYRFAGKHKTLAIGSYPKVGLAEARKRRGEARDLLAAGTDPAADRKVERLTASLSANTTFEPLAREWYERQKGRWTPKYASGVIRRLERDVFKHIGSRPVADIATPEVLAILRKIQDRGAIETAHRVKTDISQVLKYAIETGRRKERNPTDDLSSGALLTPDPRSHAAITDPSEFGALMRAIRGYAGGPVVRAALQLAPLVFVRPGELRHARWSEFDLGHAMWEIPAARMKRPKAEKRLSDAHVVPLSRQAVEILRELQSETGSTGLVFPSPRSRERPLSENAVLAALRSLGFTREQMTGHGFRASARTMLVERLKIAPEIVELQLAHAVRDPLGRSYNRVQWLDERASMMQRWADYLDALAAGGEVIPINRVA